MLLLELAHGRRDLGFAEVPHRGHAANPEGLTQYCRVGERSSKRWRQEVEPGPITPRRESGSDGDPRLFRDLDAARRMPEAVAVRDQPD